MKIAFLCGSVEIGRDGVGDYTRRLAGELIRQGHEITLVALNDQHISSTFVGIQNDAQEQISVVRIPAVLSWKERVRQVKKCLNDFNPDWVSLQFVPFSFHHKGLLTGLYKYFEELGRGRKWHIMFHELWVGMEEKPPLKFRLLGWLQRRQIKKLLVKLKPGAVHTHTGIYSHHLKQLGFNIMKLPLFTNIAVSSQSCRGNKPNNVVEISFVVFGHIHPNAPVENFAKELWDYSEETSLKVVLKFVGRSGSEQVRWKSAFTSYGLKVEVFGEQPSSEISRILSDCTFGITTTPIALVEKSSAVATMWAHHLRVLSVSNPWNSKLVKSRITCDGISEFIPGRPISQELEEMKYAAVNDVSDVAAKLINTLSLHPAILTVG
ncbi:MAG: hypothetical protein WKF70_05555 [Chitinophagaceae bacterium]